MTLEFDLFWSFRSPYSYLATGRIVEMTKRYDLRVNFRPVYPLAIRKEDFFKTVNPLWPRYVLLDIVRVSQMLGIPLDWPQPDPIVMDPETLELGHGRPGPVTRPAREQRGRVVRRLRRHVARRRHHAGLAR